MISPLSFLNSFSIALISFACIVVLINLVVSISLICCILFDLCLLVGGFCLKAPRLLQAVPFVPARPSLLLVPTETTQILNIV